MSNPIKIIILGAGISGLSLGYFLKKKWGSKIHLTILEKEENVGGWIKSKRIDGFLIEKGPRTYRGQEVLNLAKELGLEREVLLAKGSRRYIYKDGKLKSVPLSLLGPFLKGIWKDLFAKPSKLLDESVKNFGLRHFGKEFTETFLETLVLGVYGSKSEELSMKSSFPRLYALDQKYGSIILGALRSSKQKCKIFSFKEGMQTLPNTLAKHLEREIQTSCGAVKLSFANEKIEVLTSKGETLKADYLYSTLPDFNLGIPYTHLDVISLGYETQVLPLEGFGYLIPPKENEKILGVIFDSSLFKEQNQRPQETRLTIMAKEGVSDKEILAAMKRHLKIDTPPKLFIRQKAFVPQYTIGHEERVHEIEQKVHALSPHFTVLGSSFYGVSVNDCIKNAKSVAEKTNFSLYRNS